MEPIVWCPHGRDSAGRNVLPALCACEFTLSRHRPVLNRDDSLAYLKVDMSKVKLPPCAPITLAFSDLSYSVDDNSTSDVESAGRKFLLKQLSGIVRPGELLAVMGPSGCGKTTFLDLLARRIKSGMSLRT